MRTQSKPALICVVLLVTTSAWAQKKGGPSTPEERDTAVKAARLLEAAPFHKDAKKSVSGSRSG